MARTKWTNQYRKSRNAYPSRGGLLDNGQKAHIAILAREAWDKINPVHPVNPVSPFSDFATWRKHEQFLAVTGANPLADRTSRLSLRDCTQDDYLKLRAHFENLVGEPGRALNTLVADSVKDKAIAMLKLREACAERGLAIEYPGAICLRQYKTDLDHASPNQIWQLVFTVRNRRKAITPAHARDRAPDRSLPF